MNSRVHGRAIKQQRGRQTYDALVDAGFRLLETKDLDKISIAELSTEAGYSIGAFYARFNSKDEFFDALVAAHKSQRAETLKQMYEKLPVEKLVPQLVKNIIEYYQKNRHFWRASQMRNVRDPEFAQAFRDNFMYRCEIFIAHMERQLHRKLGKSERAAIVFAFQLLMSTVNNAAFNEPGPIVLGQKRYVHEMQRAFILVSGLEQLFAEIAAHNIQ